MQGHALINMQKLPDKKLKHRKIYLDVDWIIDNQFKSNSCAKPILESQTKREKERSWESRNLSD